MIEDTTSGKPEGEALPILTPTPPKGGFFSRAESAAESIEQRAVAAIEAWYAKHFHAAAVAGTAPITADDKAALIQHVADAVAPTATQE
ncbi:hypothetical protein RHOFW104T7_13150 [Rhodanobacter thiooxydans]|uniref:Uncharacterized protein n=1 Tax=Rhodanobacter thiooxydans TaxID=416169 RepID=A0A154QGY6_9GAMM|nr:hypothetical protein [Rhodanobacter thiooxydans]KZC23543.1 hypothetical protein RHOFW104T7_13150 [Rhodanobacter thiooxydans]